MLVGERPMGQTYGGNYVVDRKFATKKATRISGMQEWLILR